VFIQTRSPLVLRDLDIFKKSNNIEVGLSVTTANDEIRKIFEPYAPTIEKRLNAIETLHQNGIRTYVMIAPILPEAENLIKILAGKVDYIIIDRMNYFHADKIYEKHGRRDKNTYEYFNFIGRKMIKECAQLGIECRSAY
jgi:DNA repair photolyase